MHMFTVIYMFHVYLYIYIHVDLYDIYFKYLLLIFHIYFNILCILFLIQNIFELYLYMSYKKYETLNKYWPL